MEYRMPSKQPINGEYNINLKVIWKWLQTYIDIYGSTNSPLTNKRLVKFRLQFISNNESICTNFILENACHIILHTDLHPLWKYV